MEPKERYSRSMEKLVAVVHGLSAKQLYAVLIFAELLMALIEKDDNIEPGDHP